MSGTCDSNAIIISDSDEEQEVMVMDSQHRREEDSRKDATCSSGSSTGRHDLDGEHDRESNTASNYNNRTNEDRTTEGTNVANSVVCTSNSGQSESLSCMCLGCTDFSIPH